MGSTKVKWIGGKQFVGIDSTNHSVVLSTTDEGVGMKPSDLLLVAVSSCSSVDVVDIMAKKRTPLDFLEVITSGEQDADPPWTYRKIHMKYRVRGKGIKDKDIAQAIELSHKKYCSVATTISGVAEIITSFEILPEE
jgi:putative redox protein